MAFGGNLFARDISIHAPVKGATCWQIITGNTRTPNFNPRTREGCDYNTTTVWLCQEKISIHAPVKGATIPALSAASLESKFQSTHP